MSKKFLSPIKLAQGPSNPATGSLGEVFFNTTDFKIYAHNGTSWVSQGGVVNSDTAPSNPSDGTLWWKSDEGTLFQFYQDGDSGQWVEATNVIANVEPNPIPAGAMMAWGSDTAPANWLLCDGSAVSRSTYASLFAIIGTQYGSGDGTTTFNLPNIKGKTIVGKDASQTEFDVLGETGGAKTHTLLTSEMPSHTHVQNSHTHTFSGTTSTNGNHSHTTYGIGGFNSSGAGYLALQSDGNLVWYRGNGTTWASGQGAGGSRTQVFVGGDQSYGTSGNGDHSHTYSGTTSSATATNQDTGGGQAHNNLQPYIVLNYIIKFSAGETPGDSQLALRVGSLETSTRSVPLGGTGATSHTSGAYLKGAGTSAITSQVGIPAGDITSGTLSADRMPTGSVVQVVQTNFITRSSQSYSNATATDITGLSASITPKSTNSRIMAFVRWFGEFSPGDAPYNTVFGLKRNGTRIGEGTDNGSTVVTAITAPALSYEGTDVSSTVETASFFYLDSPSTTSAITYQVFFISNVGAGTMVVSHNKAYNWSGQYAGFELGTSNITLMEIA